MPAAEKLITENLDIWSSAVHAKSAVGRGKANKLELYGIRKLRELILELAVRGRAHGVERSRRRDATARVEAKLSRRDAQERQREARCTRVRLQRQAVLACW